MKKLRTFSVYLLALYSFFGVGYAANAVTYATWDPNNLGGTATLSGGNLTANVPAASTASSNVKVTTGKWYWELSRSAGGDFPIQGIANPSASITNYPGSDSNGRSYYGLNPGPLKFPGGTAYGSSYTTETIGVALDMDAGTVTMYKSCVSQGTMFSDVTGAAFGAMVGNPGAGGTHTFTANFGASAFSCSVPSGYNAGLYSVAAGFQFWPMNLF